MDEVEEARVEVQSAIRKLLRTGHSQQSCALLLHTLAQEIDLWAKGPITLHVTWSPDVLNLAWEQWLAYNNGQPPPHPNSMVVAATIDVLRAICQEHDDESLDTADRPEVSAQRGERAESG